MIIEKEYRLTDGISFVMGFYNPSPGNPGIKTFEFDNQFLYAIWEDGDKTKTEIDSIERMHDDDDVEIGVNLWFGEDSIYLVKMAQSDEYEDIGYDDEDDEGFDEDFTEDSEDFPPY